MHAGVRLCATVRGQAHASGPTPYSVYISIKSYERDFDTSGSSLSYLSVFVLLGLHCPLCSKFMASDEIEKHLLKCFSKMRLTYNSKTSGEGHCWTCWHQSVATATIDICQYSVWLTKEDVKLNSTQSVTPPIWQISCVYVSSTSAYMKKAFCISRRSQINSTDVTQWLSWILGNVGTMFYVRCPLV